MYKIYCLNNISPEGLALLTDNYEVIENIDEADAILVRSADMHEMEVPANLKAVARAGAGVNNIPLDKFAAAGEPRHHRRRGVGARQRRRRERG